MEDLLDELMEIEEFDINNEFVVRSHKIADKLKKKGIMIKKPVWENLKAS